MAVKKKSPPVRKRAPRSPLPKTRGVAVRMYRHGLGDCFLLRFPKRDGSPFWLMIDYGIILGTPDPSSPMKAVIDDIVATTGGEIDVLVATHEHWDHLSGFVQMKDRFAGKKESRKPSQLSVGQVWFAWTEDPENPLAKALRGERVQRLRALTMGLSWLRAADDSASEGVAAHVASLLGFFGAAGSGSTSDALDNLREFSREEPRYCHPDDTPFGLEGVEDVRLYVLGPPQDRDLLKKSSPSKGQVYDKGFQLNEEGAFVSALMAGAPVNEEGFERIDEIRDLSYPFDRRYQIPLDQARQMPFFQENYWKDGMTSSLASERWRRVDNSWMEEAARLALKLDNDTNNTSLVLAIELLPSGKVLLFPGDAQVGNWLSWHDHTWKVDPAKEIKAKDLLGRTVLYKVGHHGSHNATLRDLGLEMMTAKNLVAMVPVDHKMAVKKNWDEIPFQPLLDRLSVKTGNRVLRSDDESSPASIAGLTVSSEVLNYTDAETKKPAKRPLYYEYRVAF